MQNRTLSYREYRKLTRLREVFDDNYAFTHLLANYLNYYPELITKEMVDALCEGGDFTPEEAIVGILSEAFLPNSLENEGERTLARAYLPRSVKILDSTPYREDAYTRAMTDVVDTIHGSWEIRNELYAPYRTVVRCEVEQTEELREIVPLGFFTKPFPFLAVLENGNEWMTLTPVDMDTSREAIEAAHGRVITFGLGLGYYAFHASEKDEVSEVVVVERSAEVIKLFSEVLLPHFPHKEKIKIIEADAFRYAEEQMPREHFDLAFVDTWRDVSDGLPMYLRMKKAEGKNPDTRFLYWIEDFILSHLRSLVFEEIWERESADKLHSGESATGTMDDILYALSKEGLRKEAIKRTNGMFIS